MLKFEGTKEEFYESMRNLYCVRCVRCDSCICPERFSLEETCVEEFKKKFDELLIKPWRAEHGKEYYTFEFCLADKFNYNIHLRKDMYTEEENSDYDNCSYFKTEEEAKEMAINCISAIRKILGSKGRNSEQIRMWV